MTKVRPIFLLVLMALIPAVLFGGFFAKYILDQQRQALDQQLLDRATAISAAVERELSTQIQLLSVLSESPRLDPPIHPGSFSELAERLRARIPTWDLVRVTDLDGNVLVTVPPRSSKQVADRNSLEALVAGGKPVIGNVSIGRTGNWGFSVRVPVSRGGRTIAVLTAVLRPSAIAALVRRNIPQGNWEAWVVDGSGKLIGATDPAAPIGQFVPAYVQLEGAEEFLDEARLSDGREMRVASAKVGDMKWIAAVAMPQSQYQALSGETLAVLVATSLATVGFCWAAIFMFNRELVLRREQELAVATAQRNEALGKLTGQVAHDFNNLLMVFQAGAAAISRRPDDHGKMLRVVDSMHQAVARGKEMTQRLLSFSSKSVHAVEVVDLVGAIRDVQPLLRQAANDSISIEYAVDGTLWAAKLDLKALEIALINLVTNAREAMPDGGQVTIRARNVEDARTEHKQLRGAHVAITVSDTGSGIAPENLNKIFEPLFTTKPGGAPGLGLAQVSNFARRLGGTTTVSSVQSIGTSITIYIPAITDHESGLVGRPTKAQSLPRSMLIVDDTPTSLEAARLTFEGEAVEVVTAKSGQAALEIIRRQPDLEALLSDIMMPGMSGIELAEAARRIRPSLRIVLMTGYSDRIEQGQTLEFPVVTKPFARSDVESAFSEAESGVANNILPLFGKSS